jgi:hypothetical protein
MNRFVVFGVAMFFAIVGIALLGADNKADAGQRCCGCSGASCDGCDGGCGGCGGMRARRCCGMPKDCCGRQRRARRCCGCAGPVNCCGCGGTTTTMEGDTTNGTTDVPPAP